MAGKDPRPKREARSGRDLTTAVIYRDLCGRLRVVADHRGVTMAEALEKYGGPGIDKEYRKVVREMNAEIGGEG